MGKQVQVRSTGIELIEAQGRILTYSYTYILKMCLKSAVELRVPHVIHGHSPSPISLSALADALHLHPSKHDALRRVMRLLAHGGFFELDQQGDYYSLTPASELLLLPDHNDDGHQELPAHLFLDIDGDARTVWSSLGAWFLASDGPSTVWELVFGASIWDSMAREPMVKRGFYDAMAGDSRLVARVMVSDHCEEVFRGVESLVDVGGGTGIMSIAIAKAFPDIHCTVLDLPGVVPDSREAEAIGLANLEFVGGSMFGEIPSADAVLLKWVMHNWEDENCVKILRNCREAVSSAHQEKKKKGKVILVDMVVGNDEDFLQVQLCSDVLMMGLLNGKERTETEFSQLFVAAGFSGYKIVRQLGPRAVIEAYP